MFIVLFFIRRLVYSVSMVVLQSYQVFQIQLLFLQSILTIIFLVSVKPFTRKYINYVEIFNEFGFLVCSYHLIAYTAFQPDPFIGYMVGTSMITFTLLVALVNILVMFYQASQNLKVTWLKIKNYCRKRHLAKKTQESIQAFDKVNRTSVHDSSLKIEDLDFDDVRESSFQSKPG